MRLYFLLPLACSCALGTLTGANQTYPLMNAYAQPHEGRSFPF